MKYYNKITVTKVRSKYKVRDDAKVCKSGHDAQAKEDWYIHVEVNKHL
jgi:hypothetical protein